MGMTLISLREVRTEIPAPTTDPTGSRSGPAPATSIARTALC